MQYLLQDEMCVLPQQIKAHTHTKVKAHMTTCILTVHRQSTIGKRKLNKSGITCFNRNAKQGSEYTQMNVSPGPPLPWGKQATTRAEQQTKR